MKYFLAIDKGSLYEGDSRFKKLNLSGINAKLEDDNNLRDLWTFTTTFETIELLKTFLKENKLLSSKESYHDLVIAYNYDGNRFMPVAYACDNKYLNWRNLEDIIYKNARKPNFLDVIINVYGGNSYVASEIYSLKSYLFNNYQDYKLYDVIRSFVAKLCLKPGEKATVVNEKGLYDLAMLISKLDNPNREMEIRKVMPKPGLVKNLDDEQNRKHDDDDQMRLF